MIVAVVIALVLVATLGSGAAVVAFYEHGLRVKTEHALADLCTEDDEPAKETSGAGHDVSLAVHVQAGGRAEVVLTPCCGAGVQLAPERAFALANGLAEAARRAVLHNRSHVS